MKTLVAGHDCMEWGWVIATWVPYCRFISQRYDRTVIICREANQYLYEDFTDEFIYYDKKGETDRWLLNGKRIKIPPEIESRFVGASLKEPNQNRCMSKRKKKYLQYGKLMNDLGYDIVIHARARKEGQTQKNWPVAKYTKLIQSFPEARICSIGTEKEARHIPGTNDLRDICLKNLSYIMRNSKVVLGTSSGPLHLASHCGTPHVVITSTEYRKVIKGTNRHRYEKLWNPFKARVEVIDKYGWNAPTVPVIRAVKKFV